DQKQHLEMTRDLGMAFNRKYGETFVIPEAQVNDQVMTIPGTDGKKMSKSYGNTIDIFQSDKNLRKNIMSIVTDSLPLEAPKAPTTCNVFALYKLLGTEEEITSLKNKYLAGNYGYGHAKQELFELILSKYKQEREAYEKLINNPILLEKELQKGEIKANKIAREVLNRVREKIGY
ncbi:MAG: tryptophan--tRNA ligase, partial [Flammeovirgaceae bacterium]|nr:tryptophan--tRNA ligase [Flammeovirgaceae bacterium]